MSNTVPLIPRAREKPNLEPLEDNDRRIGAILVDRNSLTLEQAGHVVELQRHRNEKFGALAVELGYCDPSAVTAALSVQSKPPALRKEDRTNLAEHIQKILADPILVSQFNQGLAHLELRWFTGAPERKCLSFVASRSAEGCSTSVAVFAILFAQVDRRVLVIDASGDPHGQADLFGIAQESVSFEDVLADPSSCLKLPQAIPSLDLRVLVSSGNPEEVRHIQSRQFARFLDFASNNFDIVLVDTAPASVRLDAFTIAMRCSGAVAVVRLQNSKSDETRELVRGLANAGVELVGSMGTNF